MAKVKVVVKKGTGRDERYELTPKGKEIADKRKSELAKIGKDAITQVLSETSGPGDVYEKKVPIQTYMYKAPKTDSSMGANIFTGTSKDDGEIAQKEEADAIRNSAPTVRTEKPIVKTDKDGHERIIGWDTTKTTFNPMAKYGGKMSDKDPETSLTALKQKLEFNQHSFGDISGTQTAKDFPIIAKIWQMGLQGKQLPNDDGLSYEEMERLKAKKAKLQQEVQTARTAVEEEPNSEKRQIALQAAEGNLRQVTEQMEDLHDYSHLYKQGLGFFTKRKLRSFLKEQGLSDEQTETLLNTYVPNSSDADDVTAGQIWDMASKVKETRVSNARGKVAAQTDTNYKLKKDFKNPKDTMYKYVLYGKGRKLLDAALPIYMQVTGETNEYDARSNLAKELGIAATATFGNGKARNGEFQKIKEELLNNKDSFTSLDASTIMDNAVGDLFEPFIIDFLSNYNSPNDRKGKTPLLNKEKTQSIISGLQQVAGETGEEFNVDLNEQAEPTNLLENKIATDVISEKEHTGSLPMKASSASFVNEAEDAANAKKQDTRQEAESALRNKAYEQWKELYGDAYMPGVNVQGVPSFEDYYARMLEQKNADSHQEFTEMPKVDYGASLEEARATTNSLRTQIQELESKGTLSKNEEKNLAQLKMRYEQGMSFLRKDEQTKMARTLNQLAATIREVEKSVAEENGIASLKGLTDEEKQKLISETLGQEALSQYTNLIDSYNRISRYAVKVQNSRDEDILVGNGGLSTEEAADMKRTEQQLKAIDDALGLYADLPDEELGLIPNKNKDFFDVPKGSLSEENLPEGWKKDFEDHEVLTESEEELAKNLEKVLQGGNVDLPIEMVDGIKEFFETHDASSDWGKKLAKGVEDLLLREGKDVPSDTLNGIKNFIDIQPNPTASETKLSKDITELLQSSSQANVPKEVLYGIQNFAQENGLDVNEVVQRLEAYFNENYAKGPSAADAIAGVLAEMKASQQQKMLQNHKTKDNIISAIKGLSGQTSDIE